MRFTLSWLRTHLDTEAALDRIADTLSAIGLEVEAVTDPGAAYTAFRAATIISAEQHPNADRLRLCQVDVGDREPVQIVCGAPNARAGLHTIFAPPGATIPATGAILKVGAIRGVESRGMLCSLRELGLGEDHEGIAELPDTAVPGTPYARLAGLDDPLFDISVTPNRGDALSVRGVARDLAAAGLGTLRPLSPGSAAATFASPIRWSIEDHEACPWILGRTIRNVRNGPSPAWLQRRLQSVGLRPISALVDVTNFFTLDLGRPLHVFDADRVSGPVLTLRPGRPGERFEALNNDTLEVTPADCVIADDAGVQSLAGIMGGTATGSTDATTSVFVECALFDPIRIARTGRRLGLASDARARFERGVDQAFLPDALEAATRMILDLCGGEPSEIVQAGAEPAWQRHATLRFERIGGLGGLALLPDLAAERLAALGFAPVARDDASITVAVPPWRNDVAAGTALEPAASLDAPRAEALARSAAAIEAECDLLEEILRLGGLAAIPPVSLPPVMLSPVSLPDARGVSGPVLTAAQSRDALARRALAARGLAECVSFSFLAAPVARLFSPPLGAAAEAAVTLLNPIASDLDRLRPTPLASLLLAAARNAARGEPDAALFEIGAGFTPDAVTIAAGLRTGHTPRHPGQPVRPIAWHDARADALAILAALGLPIDALTTERVTSADAAYHPGCAGLIKQGPAITLARFGALHPSVLTTLGLDRPAAAFEILLDAVPRPRKRRRAAPILSAFQPVRRDFAFLLDAAVPAEAVLRAARGAERKLLASVSLFDVYEGDRLPPGRKSLAIEAVLQPTDHTLTDADLAEISARIVAAVTKATGAVLRD